MDVIQIRSFLAVSEAGSVTKAADLLDLSQSAMSGQIARLEQELSRALFTRHGRGVTLTDAGRAFRERAVRILLEIDAAKAELTIDPKAGRVSLAAIPTVAPYILPDAIDIFRQRRPLAAIEALELTTEELLAAVRHGEVDLGIAAEPIAPEGLVIESLREEELMLVLPTEHPLAKRDEVGWDDLADEPFLLLHDAHCLTGQLVGYCIRQKLAPLAVAKLHQLSTLLELVARGLGISFVPAATAAVGHVGCTFRSLAAERPSRILVLVRRKERLLSPAATEMIRVLKSGCSS